MTHVRTLLITAFTGLLCQAALAETANFVIHAQYRGLVKKAFPDIGHAGLQVSQGAGGTFHISGSCRVSHPQDKARVYEVSVNMDFRLLGETLHCLGARNSCNSSGREIKDTIERVIPFVYLVQKLPAPSGSSSRCFQTPHGRCTLQYARSEVTVQMGGAMLGKFFMSGSNQIDHFRVPAQSNVVLNFVKAEKVAE